MPLSGREAARQRQLANLTARPPSPPAGNQRARTHGGYARVAVERLDAKTREVYDALAADAPLRGPGGELPAADAAMVRLLSEVLCRLDDVIANVRDYGWRDAATGEPRPVVELEGRLRREAADYLDALAMTPRSRAKLGVDVSRGLDLAQAMSADAELERREADLARREAALDGQAVDVDA